MKISNTLTLLSFLSLGLIVSSCDIKEKKLKFDVTVISPIASKADTILSDPFITLLTPIYYGDSLVYVPEVSYKRIDLGKPNAGIIIVPISSISEFQKSLGTYTANDYKGDLETSIDEQTLKVGDILSAKSDSKSGEIEVNEFDIVWVKDSSQIIASNYVFSRTQLNTYLKSEIIKNPNKTNFKVVLAATLSTYIPSDTSYIARNMAMVDKEIANNKLAKAKLLLRNLKDSAAAKGHSQLLDPVANRFITKGKNSFAALQNAFKGKQKLVNDECNALIPVIEMYTLAQIITSNEGIKKEASRTQNQVEVYANEHGCGLFVTQKVIPSNAVAAKPRPKNNKQVAIKTPDPTISPKIERSTKDDATKLNARNSSREEGKTGKGNKKEFTNN